MPTVTFTGVKSLSPGRDGTVDIVFATRYSGDLSVTVTPGCWDELLAALSGSAAPAAARETAAAPAQPAAAPKVAEAPAAPEPASAPEPSTAPVAATAPVTAPFANGKDAPSGQMQVRLPKKWVVAADLKLHDVVLLVFDPRAKGEAAFALNPDAATKMAEGLVHHAKAVIDNVAKKRGAAPSAPN